MSWDQEQSRNTTLHVQVKLRRVDIPNITTQCWVEARKELKKGSRITIEKNKDVWWLVEELYSNTKQPHYLLHTDWTVGGL